MRMLLAIVIGGLIAGVLEAAAKIVPPASSRQAKGAWS